MERISITPRNNWQQEVEKLGFGFHSLQVPYWDESVYYSFKMDEILFIEKATAELWDMSLKAVQYVIDQNLYAQLGIPETFKNYIESSWNNDVPAIYGRFDLSYKNGQLKLLEFNADTPTSLYESGAVQWHWLQGFDATKDQFNSIQEKLIAYWKYLAEYLNPGILHFTCVKESLEDLTTTEYMRDCAIQGGLTTKLVFIDDIGWDENNEVFVDMEDQPIQNLFKLYPWEWLINESFGKNILADKVPILWIEPAWKMILSNKGILAILWKMYPYHPYLLKAYFDGPMEMADYVKKPLLSREGANITIVKNSIEVEKTEGDYGTEGFIYQELCELPSFNDHHPMIGSWIIGQESAGIGIRESSTLITNNTSRFVPHLIEG